MDSTHKRAPVGRGARRGNARSDGGDPITAATLHDALNRACAEVGIVDRDVPADGQWHPTDINGDPRGRGDGRIKLFPDGEGGIVCNWKGETRPFFVDDGRKLTEAERRDRQWRRAESIRLAQEEQARRHAKAARKASAIWNASPSATDDHSYLRRKQIQAHGARLYRGPLVVDGMPCDGSLIVPARDGSDAIRTLQFIHPEKRDGDNKRFLPGGDPSDPRGATGNAAGHPYAIKKLVRFGPLVKRGAWPQRGWPDALLVPIYGGDEDVWSIEAINADGSKDSLKDASKRGGFHPLGQIRGASRVLIAEGLANAAVGWAVDGSPGAAAMGKSNLLHAALAVRKLAPEAEIIILADNDLNVPREAQDAARAVGGQVAVPDLGGRKCDFWDLWHERGVEAVQRAIASAKAPAGDEA
jgi:phage/plasmid primase-like uncharacterized protein